MTTQAIGPSLLTLEEKKLLLAVQADLAAMRTAIVAVTAKLDADAGVTDTNYGATCNPAALTLST